MEDMIIKKANIFDILSIKYNWKKNAKGNFYLAHFGNKIVFMFLCLSVMFSRKTYNFKVAKEDNKIIGFCFVRHHNIGIFVYDGNRGKHIGEKLIRNQMKDFEYLNFGVHPWNKPAYNLYKKLGFKEYDSLIFLDNKEHRGEINYDKNRFY